MHKVLHEKLQLISFHPKEKVTTVSLCLRIEYCQSCQFSHFVAKTKDFVVKTKDFVVKTQDFW